jgi:PPOX class probable F420-dependent enzyme
MLQFEGELGERVLLRLKSELVIWLTTVSKDGTPQPNPVWFLWDGETCLVYSMPEATKVHNIQSSPKVALHFEGAAVDGGDVTILTGEAQVEMTPGPIPEAYKQKYKKAIKEFGYTWERLHKEYSAAIFIRPIKYRGF